MNVLTLLSAVLTMMVSNAVLGGVADTVAQSITAVRERALRKNPGTPLDPREDRLAIEIHELDRKNPLNDRDLIPDSKVLPPPFDFERLTRFMAYGFCMAPLQFRWFKFLDRAFPIKKSAALGPALKRVAFDQLIFAPFGLVCFFTAMTVAEGGGRRAVQQKLRDMYVPTLQANYMLWPAVQLINFRLMPVQFQLVGLAHDLVCAQICVLTFLQPFVSTVGIAWTAYLSLTNAAEDVQPAQSAQNSPRIRLA
jgi:protein Mpv17